MRKKKIKVIEETPNREEVIIIDGMNLVYRTHYAFNKLSYKGNPTGMFYGFATILKHYLQAKHPSLIVVAWDGKKHPKRLKAVPGYKGHRQEKRTGENEEAYKKFLELRNKTMLMLYLMGIPQAHNSKVEGDDMVYLLMKKYVAQDYQVRIISSDKDMLQLCHSNRVIIERPNVRGSRKGYGNPVMAGSLVEIELGPGIDETKAVDFFCLTGDSSDDIPGYRMVGPVKSSQFIRKFGSIKAFLDNKDLRYPGIKRKKLRKLWKINRLMIDLKFFCDKYYTPEHITWYKDKQYPNYQEDKFFKFCRKRGMSSLTLASFTNYIKQHAQK